MLINGCKYKIKWFIYTFFLCIFNILTFYKHLNTELRDWKSLVSSVYNISIRLTFQKEDLLHAHMLSKHTPKQTQPCTKCDFRISSEEQLNKHMRVRHEGEDGVLWAADSVMSNVDMRFLSKAMRRKIKHVKAYTATIDENSKFPGKNFFDVIDHELKDKSFEILVIGGGCVDISNLDTLSNPESNISSLREGAITSAQKLFCLSEAVLHEFPSIRKVILMKRSPRYDLATSDPLRLKPQLSALADATSFGLWCESTFRDRIILGGHDVPSGEEQICEVFGNPGDKEYDGLHMRGPAGLSFLTNSIQKVLTKANLISVNTSPYLPPGWMNNLSPIQTVTRQNPCDVPKQNKMYDPMQILQQRVRNLSSANVKAKTVNQRTADDEVFIPGRPRNVPNVQQPERVIQNSGVSVIKRMESLYQQKYNIPVSNPFDTLGN